MSTPLGAGLRPLAVAIAMLGSAAASVDSHARIVGSQIQVNTTTADDQRLSDVAMDAAGNFVVVFQNHLPVTNANVSAQRYAADGTPVGTEFQVNSTAFSGNTVPAVAMDDDGDFVVAWIDFGDDGSGYGVFGQRYDAAGQPQGINFPVNTTTANSQSRADVAMDADGDFVVVWEDNQFGNSSRAIRGQRYSAAGAALGTEMLISTDPTKDQTWPQVAMDAAGNFAVAWGSGDVGADQDVVFRLFAADGTPLTSVTQVNDTTRMDNASGVTNNLGIARDANGSFAIAWRADNATGPGVVGAAVGILARRYGPDGAPRGVAFEVDTTDAALLGSPDIAMSDRGDFLVAYEASDGNGRGIKAQRFFRNGDYRGAPFIVNPSRRQQQIHPAVAMDSDGDAVVSWEDSNDLDGDQDGVFAIRVSGTGTQPAMDFDHDFRGDLGFRNPDTGTNRLWLLDGLTVRSRGALRRLPDTDWAVAAVADFNRDGHADILWRHAADGRLRLWSMSGFDLLEGRRVPSLGLEWTLAGTGDVNRDGKADIVWFNATTGTVRVWLMDGAETLDRGNVGSLPAGWTVAGVDDFDGDGRHDVLLRNLIGGANRIWLLDGFGFRLSLLPPRANLDWTVAGTGDFDGNGHADILWRNLSGGQNVIWEIRNGERFATHVLPSLIAPQWRPVGVRDVGRDGQADIIWHRSGTDQLRVWQIEDFAQTAQRAIGKVPAGWDVFGAD